MAVVLPHGVLFRGAAEGHIRQYLIEDRNYLDAVIGLPANIFYGTSIPACILVLKKCREHPGDIFFIDAIRDENVLKFAVEYIGKYKEKEGSKTEIDIEVEDIDTKELLESTDRLGKIIDYIIANHNRKTHSRDFNALFCVSSVETLIKYYKLFKERKKKGAHNLKIATIGIHQGLP